MSIATQEKYTFKDFFAVSPRGHDVQSYQTKADRKYWRGNPPQEIIIASSSMRRGIMAAYLMSGLRFPGFIEKNTNPASDTNESIFVADQATDLQDYFRTLIPNGDGRLPAGEKALLGYLHGVPVYIERQDGETKSNEHMLQAYNKAVYMREQYKDQDVIIVAIDTVDGPETTTEQLGKPEKMPEFIEYNPDEHGGLPFEQWFLESFFPVGIRNNHHNGVAVLRTTDSTSEFPLWDLSLQLEVREEVFPHLQVFLDCGGGGVCQQLINWLSPEEVKAALPQNMREVVGDLSHEMQMWTLYCHITGMPWWAVEQMISEQYGTIERDT